MLKLIIALKRLFLSLFSSFRSLISKDKTIQSRRRQKKDLMALIKMI